MPQLAVAVDAGKSSQEHDFSPAAVAGKNAEALNKWLGAEPDAGKSSQSQDDSSKAAGADTN